MTSVGSDEARRELRAAEVVVSVVETPAGRRYVAQPVGYTEKARLHMRRVDDKRMIALHTIVPATIAGAGIGTVLVNRLVADAREEGFRIIPDCPFVRAQYTRHPEWSDVMEDRKG